MEKRMSRTRFLKKLGLSGLGMGMFGSSLVSGQVADFFKTTGDNGFEIRGFHIDLRTEVMTMKALKAFASELSQFGVNAIIMEYEATFPFQKHATISNRYAYTRKEVEDFVSYCSSLDIDVIPLQECLGHAQYILRHNRYAGLRIEHTILSQIDPMDEEAIPLFSDLIEDLISLHPSKYIHVGGDEARHLNHRKYSSFIEENGVSKLYTRYMKQICQIAIDLGKTPLVWADMILKHPEAVEDLPVDQIIFIDWNYGWDINRFGNIADLQKKGCSFWGAPALRSNPDNYYVTRWKKHFDNLKDFIPYARQADYSGIVMTSWSTSGVYSYRWEGSRRALLEMFPIRNVYPLSGFRILVAAYSKALKIQGPINPEQFVTYYAQQRFGLSKPEGRVLWNYFTHQQVLFRRGKTGNGEDIDTVMNDFKEIKNSIYQLNPAKNRNEFEHFKLIADIREFYLSVKKVESIVESEEFNRDRMDEVREKIKPLLNVSQRIDERFIALNQGYLYDSELERLNNLRNKRLKKLWNNYGS